MTVLLKRWNQTEMWVFRQESTSCISKPGNRPTHHQNNRSNCRCNHNAPCRKQDYDNWWKTGFRQFI